MIYFPYDIQIQILDNIIECYIYDNSLKFYKYRLISKNIRDYIDGEDLKLQDRIIRRKCNINTHGIHRVILTIDYSKDIYRICKYGVFSTLKWICKQNITIRLDHLIELCDKNSYDSVKLIIDNMDNLFNIFIKKSRYIGIKDDYNNLKLKPLRVACKRGDIRLCKLLLENGFMCINTAIDESIKYKHLRLTEYLIIKYLTQKYDYNLYTYMYKDYHYINNLYKRLINSYEQYSFNIILYLINSYIYINKDTLIILYDYYKKYHISNDENIIIYLVNKILNTRDKSYIELIIQTNEFKYIMSDLKLRNIDEYNKIMSIIKL